MKRIDGSLGRRSSYIRRFSVAVMLLLLLPASALAQSSISGRVTDSTGGVLPGVTVAAASPALLEQVRVVVTNGEGRFTIIDLRPGVYSVTYTLPGFSTALRDEVPVAAGVTVTLNAELSAGAIAETITVTGASPIVDVQRVARTEVIPREVMDIVPTGRDFKAIAATLPSIKSGRQNVGGTRTVQQQGISVHGLTRNNTTKYVDGLNTNTSWSEGGVQMYDNDAMAQEVAYSTSAATADVSGGGVRINIVPQEGGNAFSGAVYLGDINGGLQSDNVDQALLDRGLRGGDSIEHISDLNLSLGGPVKRDTFWFFLSFRRISQDALKANVFHSDGRQGHETNVNFNYSGRVTGRVGAPNKFTMYLDRVIKKADQIVSAGASPDTASGRRYPSLYYVGQAKWTSAISSRTLFEAGVSIPVMTAHIGYKPENVFTAFTPEWYAGARREDLVLDTATTAYTSDGGNYYYRWHLNSSMSYVTGSHSLKTGVQLSRGRHSDTRQHTADLYQRYRSGVPDSVRVFNTPVLSTNLLKADLGVYAMDSWTIDRMTINPGIRLEWFNGAIASQEAPPGRFVPFRNFPEVANMPDWFDVSPRLGVVYDVFGDSRTALKASVNKYMEAYAISIPRRYNPSVRDLDDRLWNDVDLIPGTDTHSGISKATDGDDIAQDNEIGTTGNVNFGTRANRNPGDDLQREYNIEYSVGIQHELVTGIGVSAGWYHRTFHNLVLTDNLLINSTDYLPFDVTNPLSGDTFTAYNLDPAKKGLVDLLDVNSPDSSKRSRTYDGTEVGINARFPNGIHLYGGWTTSRDVGVTCDGDDPNTLRFCDHRGLIPFRHDFKVSGAVPLPAEVQLGFSLQSYAGATRAGTASAGDGSLSVDWSMPRSVFPGGQRTEGRVLVPLIAPGTKYPGRHTQLDISVKRTFRAGGTTIEPTLSVYNALNGNNVFRETERYGGSLGRPNEILLGRLVQFAFHTKF